jgi:cbb3-type cytochrome oxidase subunit 3
MMTLHQWFGIALGLLLVGFIFFAFRQSEKVKPSGRNPNDGSAHDLFDQFGGSSH